MVFLSRFRIQYSPRIARQITFVRVILYLIKVLLFFCIGNRPSLPSQSYKILIRTKICRLKSNLNLDKKVDSARGLRNTRKIQIPKIRIKNFRIQARDLPSFTGFSRQNSLHFPRSIFKL